MPNAEPTLGRQCLAEFLGTCLLIFIGDGAVAIDVFTGSLGLLGVACVWGLAVAFAVYSFGYLSGGHYNPAVTISLSAFAGFPARRIPAFIASQVAGAFAGAALVYGFWHGSFASAAAKFGVVVGGPGSQKLAMVFACYYPNPGAIGITPADMARVSTGTAFGVEFVLTAFLMIVVLSLVNARNQAPGANLGGLFVGLAVLVIVGLGGPLTMDAVNPARDFGPRLFAWVLGFGSIAFPGPRGHEWWLYIVAPIAGGLAGSALYRVATAHKEEKAAITAV